jgi:mannan endo-1,4-beta-mannosidase
MLLSFLVTISNCALPLDVPLKPVSAVLVDPKATSEARRLYARLLKGYGKVTASGQYETGLADTGENLFVEKTVGRMPAIVGGDLSEYSPASVARRVPKDLTAQWIDDAKRGQTVTLTWHWTAPTGPIKEEDWGMAFYTKSTNFDIKAALSNPEGKDYGLLLRDIDTIAVQLRRLQDAHVPVLWRPLHEAEGGWFWWGSRGPDVCKALWKLLFNRLTKVDGLHNLVWVWNSPKAEWYPGDGTVDIVSRDCYPNDRRDPLKKEWEEMLAQFDGHKPIALAEFPGAPDIEKMREDGDRWLYFVSWYGSSGPRTTPPEVLKSTYDSKFVFSLLPPKLHLHKQ